MDVECAACRALRGSNADAVPPPLRCWHRTHGDDLDALGAAFVCVTVVAMMADEPRQAIVADALAALLSRPH